MALTIEWRKRVDHWVKILPSFFYRQLGTVALEGFETLEQLTPQVAAKGSFRSMPVGAQWGQKWAYGWFRCRMALPAIARGQRMVFKAAPGGETLVFVNGVAAGAFDKWHKEITLARRARGGEKFSILMESYAGHGPRVEGNGPVPYGVETIPEVRSAQQQVGPSSFGVWEEDLYQLWLDVTVLLKLRDVLPADSLRVQEIDKGLRDFSVVFDPERPLDEMRAASHRARALLRPLLACRNGSTAPELYCFGHSHIDVAWLWPLQETERKCGRTFSSQLRLMEEYPEYKFLQSQPHLYRMVRERYPEIYRRMKQAVRRGRVIAEGGMWVEADTNISGGEALIRQFLHGLKFFEEELGASCEMLWLPDVFGYSGALPQIMQGCGIRHFSTQKIFWNYNGGDMFPYNTFWWEGIDGSRVLSHFHNDYNSQTTPADLADRWNNRVQKDGISTRLMPFGWGDGGGGATRDHLEFLRRERDLEGLPCTRMAAPAEYFHRQERDAAHLPSYVGELYFQCHRGTYTSQARTKRGNRKCEVALRDAEMWAVAARALKGRAYPAKMMDKAWKGLLLNQFHDIIPGSSIHRVYEEAEALYRQVEADAAAVSSTARKALVKADADCVTVFNTLSWPRRVQVALPKGAKSACDEAGKPLPVQVSGKAALAAVVVPSCGWTTVHAGRARCEASGSVKVSSAGLENNRLRVKLNDRGELTSVFDKDAGCELLKGPSNLFQMFKDVPTAFDAWDLDSTYQAAPVSLPGKAVVTVELDGPLLGSVRVERKLHQSRMVQSIRLAHDSRRIDFVTEIDWQERHKVLKVGFATGIHAAEALHEIQFGHLPRPNHTSRPFDGDRFEVPMHRWSALVESGRGCAVLNDCKYGGHVTGGSIHLTLLRSPMAPDMTADLGRQSMTYSFYAWNGDFANSDLVREGYELNMPATVLPGWGGAASLLEISCPDVILESMKPAEDGSGDVVLRLYESKRNRVACKVTCHLPVTSAWVTDMREQQAKPLKVAKSGMALTFRPFEIKTIRLRLA
jgi:alpha-mannosidase